MCDLREYGKKYRLLIAASGAAVIFCFGFLLFGGTIRIDTEELINRPGTTVGWLTIGRFGLVFLKRLLGLSAYHPVISGVLFLLFFWLGANLLTYELYRFSGKREDYPYAVFLMLYVTSGIWSYQVYFTLQHAEVAFAMFLLIIAAVLAVRACIAGEENDTDPSGKKKGRLSGTALRRISALLTAAVLLVIGLGAYQALASYYIVICIALFLMDTDSRRERGGGRLMPAIMLSLHFILSYVMYRFIANTWFMAGADYMDGQMGWGRLPVTECIKNILRTVRNVLIGYGPRNFSFYTAGVILVLMAVPVMWRRAYAAGTAAEREPSRDAAADGRRRNLIWRYLTLAGIIAAPFLMTIYMGEMLVTRSQFALPVSAAFLGMYGLWVLQDKTRPAAGPFGEVRAVTARGEQTEAGGVPEEHVFGEQTEAGGVPEERVRGGKQTEAGPSGEIRSGNAAGHAGERRRGAAIWIRRAAWLCVAATIVIQCTVHVWLAYTDQVRFRQDAERARILLAELERVNNGSLPEIPVIFVGYQSAELTGVCRRTEMYGWSFFEWDYSVERPTGATHRIVGFVQAYTKNRLNEEATEEQKERAAVLAAGMPDFPAEGCVQVTGDFVVVRLSGITERTDNDWW